MSNKDKIEEFKKLSNEELRRISRDPFSSESDFIIASVELGHRNINQLLMINKYLEYSKNKQTSDSKKNKEENYYSLDKYMMIIGENK